MNTTSVTVARSEVHFKESQPTQKTDNFVASKLFQARAQEPFFKELTPLLSDKKVKVEVFDTQNLHVPNNVALKKICERYQVKYGIQIEVVESSSLSSLWSRLKSQENKPLYVGIILTDPDKPYAHACPILCHIAAEDECYIMDVLGRGYPFDFTRLLQCHAEASSAFTHIGVKIGKYPKR